MCPVQYIFETIQSPVIGAAFGRYELSRRPIQPPLVVRLSARDEQGDVDLSPSLPFLVAHVSLTTLDGSQHLDLCYLPSTNSTGYRTDPFTHTQLNGRDYTIHGGEDQGRGGETRNASATGQQMVETLYGTMVAGGNWARLERDSIIFAWPDISVRIPGTYRLWISLFRIGFTIPESNLAGEAIVEILGDVFHIVEAGEYQSPDTTPLTEALRQQSVL